MLGEVFPRFFSIFGTQNEAKTGQNARPPISRKSWFYYSKTYVFEVRDPPKLDAFAVRNTFAEKTRQKGGFSSI